jgi:hypothetical protein
MAIYPTKAAFFAEGIEVFSMPYDKPDCSICRERLQLNALVLYKASTVESLKSTANTTPATRIVVMTAATDNPTYFMPPNAPTVNDDQPVVPVENHEPIKTSCCKNFFGRYCLESWLSTANSGPYCRAELFPKRTQRTHGWIELGPGRNTAVQNIRNQPAPARPRPHVTVAHLAYVFHYDGLVADTFTPGPGAEMHRRLE